jgi:3-hydroxyisobutyrate dehydrogenase-like beta-hydroxyacid dehydrogenase
VALLSALDTRVTFMQVGCDPGALESHPDALAVLRTLGGEPRVLGAVGSASAVKLALNQLIITETVGSCVMIRLFM